MKVVNNTYKLELRRKDVLSLFNEGLSSNEIAEILNVSSSTISRDLKSLGKKPKPGYESIDNTIDKSIQIEICKLYEMGFSFSDIVKQLNISTTAIKNALVRNNVRVRKISEGNSLKWKDDKFRKNQIDKRKGKKSGAYGKNWKLLHIRKNTNSTGEKNHFWKGGITKLSSEIRNSVEYSYWRKKIFERDNYTCQICSRRSKKGDKVIIEADHIYPFHKLLNDFDIKSISDAVICQKLWNIDNGRSLCRECHKKTDSYGSNQYS